MRDVPLGTLIFRAGLLGEEQLEDALQEGMRTGKRLGEVLLERGWLNERDLGQMLAGQKGLPFVDVAVSDVEPDALKALDQEDARRQVALPLFYEDGELVIAVGDPSNEVVLEGLRREINTEFQLVVAPHGQLLQVIDEAYARPDPEPSPQLEGVLFPNLRARAENEAPAEPAPQPDLGFVPALEPEVAAESEAESSPELESPQEPEPGRDGEEKPFAGSTPTLLSRMLFPSVRHAAHEAEGSVGTEQEEPPAAAQPERTQESEAPGPAGEDFAELEVPAPPEMPVSSFDQQAPEPEVEPKLEAEPEPPAPEEASEPEPEPVAEMEQSAPDEASQPAPEPEPEPEPLAETERSAPEEASQPAPEPVAEEHADEPHAMTHVVVVRLRDGEAVRIGEHPNAAAASAQAAKTVSQIAAASSNGKWPLFDDRYLSPDTIVSVDLLEEPPDA
jgi:hypothetical protein